MTITLLKQLSVPDTEAVFTCGICELHSTVTLPGQLTTVGGVVSWTVMVWVQVTDVAASVRRPVGPDDDLEALGVRSGRRRRGPRSR